jgi:hypothetical protein
VFGFGDGVLGVGHLVGVVVDVRYVKVTERVAEY